MAGEALQNLMRNRNAIRRIMSMDNNGTMDKIMENALTNGVVTRTEDGVAYNPTLNQDGSSATRNQGGMVLSEKAIKKSKLPQKVIESMQKNPLNINPQASVLDGLNLSSLTELREETQHQAPTPQPAGGVIDYSLLKTIINEAVHENVKRYMTVLSKKLLTENVNINGTNTIQAVKFGDKFSFITENGDVYEATLKYKTNLNAKKTKKQTVAE